MWKCFILNKVCDQNEDLSDDNDDWTNYIRMSGNNQIGILPPGMISNEEDLFNTEFLE
jgi:hypothetical protein